ncbi:MAG TPA: sialidase family protein, partial [Gammaproteobacteria bacterium]|nr:sialidase family protein [Gammaproteobacteria bacterium]
MSDMILLGTRKGIVIFDRINDNWRPRPIAQAGIPVCYSARDARDGTLWACLDHGHWGPKLSRSQDGGATWKEMMQIKYPEGARYIVKYLPTPDFDPESPTAQPEYADATVYKIWHIAFGSADQPGRLYAGTIPGGLFVSDDGGDSWELNRPLW